MTKCVIVGSGFLGSYVAGDIMRFPENELVIVEKRTRASVFDHKILSRYSTDPRLKFKWQSSSDALRILPELKEAEVIIYTSAIADVPYAMASPIDAANVNVMNTLQFMEALRASEFNGRMIHLSSESIYGHQPIEKLPIKEDDVIPNPTNIYGTTKLAQELIVRSYFKTYGIKTMVLRSATMYGPGARLDQAIPIFMRKALMNEDITLEGDGSQTRDFNYVTNMMDAIRICWKDKLTDTNLDGDVYNIASGKEVTLNAVVQAIKLVTKSQSKVVNKPWRAGEQGLRVAMDITKAREKMGYEPVVHMIPAGLRNTALWMAQYVLGWNREMMSELETKLGIAQAGRQVGQTVTGVDPNPVPQQQPSPQ